MSKVDGASAIDGASRWHLGVGGNVQAAYKVTKNLSVGIYTGMTYMTGKAMDGMPELHNTNYVWESGIKLGWTFGKCRKNRKAPVPAAVAPAEKTPVGEKPVEEVPTAVTKPVEEVVAVEVVEQPTVEEVVKEEPVVAKQPANEEEKPAERVTEQSRCDLPTIYFAFNSTRIRYSELPKVQQIRDMMQENPEMTIEVIGWCDSRGATEYNKVFSEWRADAVKRCLVSYGIDAERIATQGMGIDADKSDVKGIRP